MSAVLTAEDIHIIEDDRFIDVWVAEKVMGWEDCDMAMGPEAVGRPPGEDLFWTIPNYSTSMDAAMTVADRLYDNYAWETQLWVGSFRGRRYGCIVEDKSCTYIFTEFSNNQALNICRAALRVAHLLEIPESRWQHQPYKINLL